MNLYVLGESLMDCLVQPDGSMLPVKGGSPYNMARAASLQGTHTTYLNPLSQDVFGQALREQLAHDGVHVNPQASTKPTALAVVHLQAGQPAYGFYREGIADRDYTSADMVDALRTQTPGVLHTGSLLLIPPEHHNVLDILRQAKSMGWVISVDVNMRPSVAPDLQAYNAAVEEVIDLADWLKASDEDLQTLGYTACTQADAAQMADQLLQRGVKRLALTYGAQGAYLRVGDQSLSAPVPSVDVIDTVGAGDTFWGNCVSLWSQMNEAQAQAGLHDTLQHALWAAALNCTRRGCQPPLRSEVAALL